MSRRTVSPVIKRIATIIADYQRPSPSIFLAGEPHEYWRFAVSEANRVLRIAKADSKKKKS